MDFNAFVLYSMCVLFIHIVTWQKLLFYFIYITLINILLFNIQVLQSLFFMQNIFPPLFLFLSAHIIHQDIAIVREIEYFI